MSEEGPLFDDVDDDNKNGVDKDTTRPFPDDGETPGPSGEEVEMTSMNRGKEKGKKQTTAETSFTIEKKNIKILIMVRKY